MSIIAVLSVDGGTTFSEGAKFEVKPAVGEIVRFWRNGREATEARVTAIAHVQTEDGFVPVVEAETSIR